MESNNNKILPQIIDTSRLYLSNIVYIDGTITKVSGATEKYVPIPFILAISCSFGLVLLQENIQKAYLTLFGHIAKHHNTPFF